MVVEEGSRGTPFLMERRPNCPRRRKRSFAAQLPATWKCAGHPLDVQRAMLESRASGISASGYFFAGWWFGTCLIFPYIGNNHPNWLIFFRGVQTTNQLGWFKRPRFGRFAWFRRAKLQIGAWGLGLGALSSIIASGERRGFFPMMSPTHFSAVVPLFRRDTVIWIFGLLQENMSLFFSLGSKFKHDHELLDANFICKLYSKDGFHTKVNSRALHEAPKQNTSIEDEKQAKHHRVVLDSCWPSGISKKMGYWIKMKPIWGIYMLERWICVGFLRSPTREWLRGGLGDEYTETPCDISWSKSMRRPDVGLGIVGWNTCEIQHELSWVYDQHWAFAEGQWWRLSVAKLLKSHTSKTNRESESFKSTEVVFSTYTVCLLNMEQIIYAGFTWIYLY